MSAAEKLKALEAQPNQMAAAWHIAGVLPQIVAVVEAAEKCDKSGIARHGLSAALAALDEALGEEKDENWRSGLWRQRS